MACDYINLVIYESCLWDNNRGYKNIYIRNHKFGAFLEMTLGGSLSYKTLTTTVSLDVSLYPHKVVIADVSRLSSKYLDGVCFCVVHPGILPILANLPFCVRRMNQIAIF